MIIRAHNSNDFIELSNLRWQLKTYFSDKSFAESKTEFIERNSKALQASEVLNNTVHWVAEDRNQLIRAMTTRFVRKELSPATQQSYWGYLTNSFVQEDHRNQGLGTQLLKYCINKCRQRRLELLIVWPSDRSYEFYRRQGFVGTHDPLELLL